jgi:type II secretion system protein H
MRRAGAFTLVELVLVMALLCVILGLAAPSLSRSMHQRNLAQEATRLLAVTEYARDEAVSQGAPMVVWIDADTGHFGAKAMPGYEDSGARSKEFTLLDGLHFDTQGTSVGSAGEADAAEFTTDGTLDPSSQTSLRLVDRSNSAIEITQTSDAWGYEIVKNPQQ